MIPTTIQCSTYFLRKLKKEDVNSITKHVNNIEIAKWTARIPHPYTKKDGEWFVSKSIKEWEEGTGYVFGIVIDEEVVGICGLDDVSKEHKHATLGYWISQDYWGQGIMSEVAEAVIKFGFTELRLHRISVSHFTENTKSQRIIEKLGFRKEGITRDEFYRFGEWKSHVKYGMLEEDYVNST